LASKELAPKLYKKGRFKKGTVFIELQNSKWINNIGEVQETELLLEYVLLYLALTTITLMIRKILSHGNGQLMVSSNGLCLWRAEKVEHL
jgi:hypothetical protein